MKNPFAFACFAAVAAFGCSASQTPDGTPPAPSSGQTVEVPPPPAVSAETPDPAASAAQLPPAASATAPEEPKNPAGGRLAFTSCTDEQRKAKGCTKEMKPVCGEVDTGIRCIRAPCPSSAKQTFSNACLACVEPKTTGYWPMSCEDMSKPSTSTM